MNAEDTRLLRIAYDEAKSGFDEGGCPIGSVLARGGEVVAQGRNQRVQKGDPIAHGEMDALRKAGRQKTYRDTTLYTSLSPCMMCTGTIIQFGIPRVVIGENNNFGGNEEFLRSKGVEVIVADDPDCIALMQRFIEEKPELWAEDIADVSASCTQSLTAKTLVYLMRRARLWADWFLVLLEKASEEDRCDQKRQHECRSTGSRASWGVQLSGQRP